jgi:predicted amidohydrolase
MAGRCIELFAVQAHITAADYAGPEHFARKISSLFDAINHQRERTVSGSYRYPALAVFPEDIGTFLVLSPFYSLVDDAPGLEEALRRIVYRRLPRVAWHRARYRASAMRSLFLMAARPIYEIYYRTFSSLARRHGLTVVAGSVLVPENRYGYTDTFQLDPRLGSLYNLSLTFNPRGEVIHATRKINLLSGLEAALELSPGPEQELRPFEVAGVRCGNMICYDGFLRGHSPDFRPVAQRLVSQGAEILTQPSANPASWLDPWPHRPQGSSISQRDAWMKDGLMGVMELRTEALYGVNPMLNGRIFDLLFEGQSTLLGRDTQGDPCVLARAAAFGDRSEAEEVLRVLARLPDRLRLTPPPTQYGRPAVY